MSVFRKDPFINPVNVTIAFFVTAGTFLVAVGGQSKVSQCYQLILVVDQGSSLINQNKDAANTNQLVHNLDKVTQNLVAVNLQDTKLKEFQNQFIKTFQAMSQAISNAGKALNLAKKAEFTLGRRAKVEKAKLKIEAAAKTGVKAAAQADILATEVNQYCSEK